MVEANRGWLLRLLAGVFVMLGTGETVRRRVWREALARVVPMESALRRLIAVMARDLEDVLPPEREHVKRAATGKAGRTAHAPVFRLTDLPRLPDPAPRPLPCRREPRILSLDDWTPETGRPKPSDDDLLDGAALRRRLAAMKAALGDLPAQAKRLARWTARGARMRQAGTWRRLYTIRSGRPPGYRAQGKREVDEVLANCHDLALRCRAMIEAERYGA